MYKWWQNIRYNRIHFFPNIWEAQFRCDHALGTGKKEPGLSQQSRLEASNGLMMLIYIQKWRFHPLINDWLMIFIYNYFHLSSIIHQWLWYLGVSSVLVDIFPWNSTTTSELGITSSLGPCSKRWEVFGLLKGDYGTFCFILGHWDGMAVGGWLFLHSSLVWCPGHGICCE